MSLRKKLKRAAQIIVNPLEQIEEQVDIGKDVVERVDPQRVAIDPGAKAQEAAASLAAVTALAEKKRKERESAQKRRGRRASILTSARGIEDELGSVNRPEARGAVLLGQNGLGG